MNDPCPMCGGTDRHGYVDVPARPPVRVTCPNEAVERGRFARMPRATVQLQDAGEPWRSFALCGFVILAVIALVWVLS